MARPRGFNPNAALEAAIDVFRERGFNGASAQMLVDAMGIGRQSLYVAFGDKWQLYCAAVRRYGMDECAAHLEMLRSGGRAIDGIAAMLRRVVKTAAEPCLGVGSIYEFGTSRPELAEIKAPFARAFHQALTERIRDAQREGDAASNRDPETVARFLSTNIAGIRVAGRAGADQIALSAIGEMALQVLR
jgi:TetR/AcrR family transcriptional regulator, transcriptional repressor for nem operon